MRGFAKMIAKVDQIGEDGNNERAPCQKARERDLMANYKNPTVQ